MTPRKELYIKIKQALKNIPAIELIDLQRKQFSNPEKGYGDYWTAALVKISAIRWESMVEQKQEGVCTVEVTLYCKDGWMDQHDGTTDADDGLTEIDLIDDIVENLQFLEGDFFRALELSNESSGDDSSEIMDYTLTFTTNIYRRINAKYSGVKFKINQSNP